jgi:hypothetical protein
MVARTLVHWSMSILAKESSWFGVDHDVVVPYRGLAVVRVVSVCGGGVRSHDRVLVRKDADDPPCYELPLRVGLLYQRVTHLHEDEVGRGCHRFVAGTECALSVIEVLHRDTGTAFTCDDRELLRKIILSDLYH